jgi:iron complex transport system substrate-binding protein
LSSATASFSPTFFPAQRPPGGNKIAAAIRLRDEAPVKICSLLPSATEILYALGLGDSVAGVTHECDYPLDSAGRMPTEAKPALIRPRVDPQARPAELDRQVMNVVARGESIYAVDAELLASLAPDLIVTQDLCHVCAASPDDLATALAKLPKQPRVLSLTPHSLADVWGDIRRVGGATGRPSEAETLAKALEQRVEAVEAKAAQARSRPRVLCLEWLDPYYIGGHWVPEMVALAGGEDVLGRAGEPSFRATVAEIAKCALEVIVVMPCGYNVARTAAELSGAQFPAEWNDLPAVRERRIFAVDANSYFSRPGPRLADGVELLAQLIHPGLFPEVPAHSAAFRRL